MDWRRRADFRRRLVPEIKRVPRLAAVRCLLSLGLACIAVHHAPAVPIRRREVKDRNLFGMETVEGKRIFEQEFVPAWNSSELFAKYYVGIQAAHQQVCNRQLK